MSSVPLSFEFFPPNTPVGSEKLKSVVRDLAAAQPEFFSVTYGAGGGTREKTLATVRDIAAMGFEAAPHLSCVGSTEAGIAEILAAYRAQGIRRLVALRGDLPSGTATAGEFRYASELVAFIRRTQGADWFIEVAAYPEYHPQQRYARRDLEHFAAKHKRRRKTMSAEALRLCQRFPWPGNVRQLRNLVERVVITCRNSSIETDDLPEELRAHDKNATTYVVRAGMSLAEAEKLLIRQTLTHVTDNREEAARVLGISRRALQYKLKEYGLSKDHKPARASSAPQS